MTREEILALEGNDLNKAVAIEVMGFEEISEHADLKRKQISSYLPGCGIIALYGDYYIARFLGKSVTWNPHENISVAFEVIKKMREKGYDYAIESLNDSLNAGGDLTHVRFFKRLEGDYHEYDSEVSVMHGISICALLAVLGEEE